MCCLNNSVKGGEAEPYWYSLSNEQKEELKNRILAPLADDDNNVRLSAWSWVATVACLELSRGEWQDIIQNLCNNSYNEEDKIKQSSLKTLGYIWEELESSVLDKEQTSIIVTALLEALVSNTKTKRLWKYQ